MRAYRQGDVSIMAVESVPKQARKLKDESILARGEFDRSRAPGRRAVRSPAKIKTISNVGRGSKRVRLRKYKSGWSIIFLTMRSGQMKGEGPRASDN